MNFSFISQFSPILHPLARTNFSFVLKNFYNFFGHDLSLKIHIKFRSSRTPVPPVFYDRFFLKLIYEIWWISYNINKIISIKLNKSGMKRYLLSVLYICGWYISYWILCFSTSAIKYYPNKPFMHKSLYFPRNIFTFFVLLVEFLLCGKRSKKFLLSND